MHIFFSVGEPSGDQHAAQLIGALRARSPELRISGFGGPLMEQAGCSVIYPLTNLAVMGFLSVLPMIGKFLSLVKQADEYFERHRPDMVVLVDFPGFNWHIARKAKARGIPVVYYLPPQLWAWAPWRIRRVHKYVDLVLSGLKFETEWYANRGVPVMYVGHPFFEEVEQHPVDATFCREWSGPNPVIAILPGSRGQEVAKNWPILLEIVRRLHRRRPEVRFLVANYKESQRQTCCDSLYYQDEAIPMSFFVGKTPEIISLAHCAVMVSGSVSLEMVARQTPATVIYRCSWSTYLLGRLLVTCKYMTLANLMRGRVVMPEFVSVGNPEPTIRRVLDVLERWLSSPADYAHTKAELRSLHEEIATTGTSSRVAAILMDRLHQTSAARPIDPSDQAHTARAA